MTTVANSIFTKYNSIENSYNQKIVENIKMNTPENTIWMVQEKIHGANFGIFYDKETDSVHFGKRTSLLTKDTKFYNCRENFPEWEALTRKLVKQIGCFKKSLTVRGELCGGRYPGFPGKGVQKGIDYSNKIVFVAFDLQIDGVYVPLHRAMTDLQLAGFHVVRVLGMFDTLDEALEYDIDFSSKLPEELGMLPHPDKNQCEGIVIKPVPAFFLDTGSRAILKKKNEIHTERKTGVPKSPGKFQNICNYLTQGRYQSVKSKLDEDFKIPDIGKAMTDDVIDDYLKDHEIDSKELKALHKKAKTLCFKFAVACMKKGI